MISYSEYIQTRLDYLNDNRYLVNPYFRIPKENKENKQKYRIPLEYNFFLAYLTYLLIVFPGMLILFCLKLLTRSLFIILPSQKTQDAPQEIYDNLLLTHYVKNNQFKRDQDPFYGTLISNLEQNNFSNLYLYSNQMRRQPSKEQLSNLIAESSFLIPKLIPKELYLKYAIEISQKSIKLLKLSITQGLKKESTAFFYLIAAARMFNRETYVTFNLVNSLVAYVEKYQIRNVFITFEGHAFEELILIKLQDIGVNLYLLQHSPITMNQQGVRNLLNNANEFTHICVTGDMYANYFREKVAYKGRVFKIGTYKHRIKNIKYTEKSNTILFAPEGKLINLLSYLRTIIKLEQLLPGWKVILRIHPNLKVPIFMRVILRFYQSRNIFKISNQELETDLAESKFVVYRSSAVGIECLFFDCTPLYFAAPDDSQGDALIDFEGKSRRCYSTEDIVGAVRVSETESSKSEILGSMYFDKTNYTQLNNSLNRNL